MLNVQRVIFVLAFAPCRLGIKLDICYVKTSLGDTNWEQFGGCDELADVV